MQNLLALKQEYPDWFYSPRVPFKEVVLSFGPSEQLQPMEGWPVSYPVAPIRNCVSLSRFALRRNPSRTVF